MARFVLQRLLSGIVVLAALSFASFCFFASQMAPLRGNPVLPAYWRWVRGLANGHSYHSLTRGAVVPGSNPPRIVSPSLLPTLSSALGHTVVLLVGALLLVTVLSIVLASIAAARRGSAVDVLLRTLSYAAWAVPAFLVALLLQLLVFHVGGPFPLAGWPGFCPGAIGLNAGSLTCPPAGSGTHYAVGVLRHVALPVLALALGFVGLHGRYLRSALIEQLGAPYVVTARAKGLTERRVLLRHALRASLITFLAALFADFGAVFGAALAVDWIFQLQGLGTVLVSEFPIESFAEIDTYSVQLVLLITGCLVVLSSILGEIAVASLDPRVRSRA